MASKVPSLATPATTTTPTTPTTATATIPISKCVVGICAMEKKTSAKPLREIVRHLRESAERYRDAYLASSSSAAAAAAGQSLDCSTDISPVTPRGQVRRPAHVATSTPAAESPCPIEIEIVIFSNHTILDLPVEQWPRVDCLLAWFSSGFPLSKVHSVVPSFPRTNRDPARSHMILINTQPNKHHASIIAIISIDA